MTRRKASALFSARRAEGDQVISMALAEHEDTEDVSAEAEVSTEISANEENPTAET